MPSLQDMRQKAKEAGLMKLDRLIATRQHIPANEFPVPLTELCERYEKLYTGCINDVMRELCLLNQNLPSEIMPLRDLPGKWKAFGWNVLRCDGHDLAALDAALDAAAACKGVPTVILADTIKGKGVSFMEGKSAWHGKAIPDAEFAQAMQELGGNV